MSNGENVTVNLKHKDRLFNFLFGREENRKSNMPLRLMEYVGRLYSGYISSNKLNKYGERLIALPTPKLVVFYNGLKEQADETILRLSDSFDKGHRNEADIEVRVRMLNVNHGRNKELMDKCKPLAEYAWFIEEIRKNRKEHDTEVSVKLAIEAMPDDFVIKGFLIEHMKEVQGMLDTEYNEAEVKELFREEGREEEAAERISDMLRRGKTIDEIVDFCGYPKEQVEEVERSMLATNQA